MRLLIPLALLSCLAPAQEPQDTPPELGRVRWRRDLDVALALPQKGATATDKPTLLLFQEIPG